MMFLQAAGVPQAGMSMDWIQIITQGGMSAVGVLLVVWLVKVFVPQERERAQQDVERAYAENERDRHAFSTAIERICSAHEKRTEAMVGDLKEIHSKVDRLIVDVREGTAKIRTSQ